MQMRIPGILCCLITFTGILTSCSRAPDKLDTEDRLEAYAIAHDNSLPNSWNELSAWCSSNGRKFSASDAAKLENYTISAQRWLDTTENAPPYVTLKNGATDVFAASLNHDLHLFLGLKMVEAMDKPR